VTRVHSILRDLSTQRQYFTWPRYTAFYAT